MNEKKGGNMSYYNTTNLDSDDLRTAKAKTMKQDDVILEIFEYHPEWSYTPGQVMHIASNNFGKRYPITSIRRSINTLTKAGKLHKTRELRNCIYGKKAHCWIYNAE